MEKMNILKFIKEYNWKDIRNKKFNIYAYPTKKQYFNAKITDIYVNIQNEFIDVTLIIQTDDVKEYQPIRINFKNYSSLFLSEIVEINDDFKFKLSCGDVDCSYCPLEHINCNDYQSDITLYDAINQYFDNLKKDYSDEYLDLFKRDMLKKLINLERGYDEILSNSEQD